MAVDAAVPRAEAAPVQPALARAAAVPARVVLAGIVAVSVVVRFVAALTHATPLYFPDEYIYSELARSIAETGRPLIRGTAASFPALLEPLLAAPAWLVGGPEVAYRLTQGLNAVAMSLAAVPVYLLARRLRLGQWTALGAALLAVVCPDLFYVSFLLAEPIAYPLALGAILLAVCALSRPTRWNQIGFFALAGLAVFARAQYIVLIPAFLLAAVLVRRLRGLRLSVGLTLAPVALIAALGPSRLLGYYSGVADLDLDPVGLLQWVGIDLMMLAYASGWVLVPGALAGLVLAAARPRFPEERAFAVFVGFLAGGLLLEAGLYATNAGEIGGRFQERYLLALLPLALPAFGLYLGRAAVAKAGVALAAFGLVALSARIPLSGYTSTHGRQDSPFLLGVYRLEESVGIANGALAIAVIVAALSLTAAFLALRPQHAALVATALAAAFLGAVSVGAFALDHRNATNARATYLPADARWVDHAGLGPVTLLQTAGTPREMSLEQLFWNTSIKEVVRLRQASVIDAFRQDQVRDLPDGTLLRRGRALVSPLLVPHYAVQARFSGASRVGSTILFDLWKPHGRSRLALLAGGHYYDNWLAVSGYVRLYGSPRGTLRFTLFRPDGGAPAPMRLTAPGYSGLVDLDPGEQRTMTIPVRAQGVWTLKLKTAGGAYLADGRAVSVRSSMPVFTTSS